MWACFLMPLACRARRKARWRVVRHIGSVAVAGALAAVALGGEEEAWDGDGFSIARAGAAGCAAGRGT